MSDKITTLHPYDDDSTNVYPNIKSENIPDGSVTESKLDPSIVDKINNLSEKYTKTVTTNTEQQITAQKTFTQGIKTNKVTNINGYDDMNDDGSNLTLGNSSRVLKLNGSQARPSYNGSEIALLGDTNNGLVSTVISSLSYGRWKNVPLYHESWVDATMYDPLAPYYDSLSYYLANAYFTVDGTTPSTKPIYFATDDFFGTTKELNCCYMFYNLRNASVIYLPNMNIKNSFSMFYGSNLTKILVKDGCTVKLIGPNQDWTGMFQSMPNLNEIGAIDMSEVTGLYSWTNPHIIGNSPNVKSIHCTHWKISFDISDSTAFEESDLVEIISNLDPVSTTMTLTMGATNLAKLTNEEILVATGKGWVLA